MNPWQMSASRAIPEIRAGKLRSAEWARSCLSRADSLEPQLRAWAFLNPEIPLRHAEEADHSRARGGTAGPLEGAPIGVKDIFNTTEMPTEMGSPLWKGFTPGNDARVVAALKRSGGIVLGKTVTSEFAVHAPGPTRNPHDLARSPGTSSSGSAVAVATGMVPLALGSQTAGSTIRPASYCGIYGFKPSFGLLPRTGMLKTTDTLDHVSFLARNIDDLRLIFDRTRVRGSNHPVVQQRVDPTAEAPDPSGWRVGFVRGPKWEQAKPYAREALERFVGRLAAVRGVSVVDVNLPPDFARIHDVHQRIYCRMLAYYFKAENRTPDALSGLFRSMLEEGAKVGPAEYRDCLDFQARATQDLDRLFEEKAVDLLLTLSTGSEAPLGLEGRDLPDNCLIWTFCGVPALSIPVFTAPSGLPFGAQLVGRKYGDYPLLQFARLLTQEGFLQERSPVEMAQRDPAMAESRS